MARIQKDGFVVTRSEVTKGLVGVAAPVFASAQVVAGLSLVVDQQHAKLEKISAEVRLAAAALSKRLELEQPWIPR